MTPVSKKGESVFLSLGAKSEWRLIRTRCQGCGQFDEAPWWDVTRWKPVKGRKDDDGGGKKREGGRRR